MMIAGLIHLVGKVVWNAFVVLVCASLVFIGYKANQSTDLVSTDHWMRLLRYFAISKVKLLFVFL